MFDFFRGKKDKALIEKLLVCLFEKAPDKYRHYLEQVLEGVIRKTFPGSTYRENYLGIAYNTVISKKYENPKKKSFSMSGMKIFDNNSGESFEFEVFFDRGLISGINAEFDIRKCDLDFSSIDIELLKVKEDKLDDDIKDYLNRLGFENFNETEVYKVEYKGVTLFHLRDLDDGDMLSVNDEGFFIISMNDNEVLKVPSRFNDEVKNGLLKLSNYDIYSYFSD